MKHINEEERATITRFDLLFESRVTRLESATINIEKSLYEIKESIKSLRDELKSDIRSQGGDLKDELRELRKESRAGFIWLLSTFTTLITALGATMAHGFHWF